MRTPLAGAAGSARLHGLLLLAVVVLVALSLRGPIAAVAPVLDEVTRALELDASTAGLLTALPVLCFAAASALIASASVRYGPERLIFLGLIGIAFGIVLRSAGGVPAALAGTAVLGLAITAGNVLVPVVIKRDFPRRVGTATGLYTAALAGGAALTAAATAPVAELTGWQVALALWALLAVAGAFGWRLAFGRGRPSGASDPPAAPARVWTRGTAWAVAGFFGAQSGLYYAMTAWLPTMLGDTAGLGAGTAGAAMAIFQVVGIVTTLTVPPLATRYRDQRGLAVLVAGTWVVALAGLLAAPELWPLWSIFGGLAQGAGISLGFTLIILRAGGLATVGRLSGMVQAVGYTVSASAPLLVGAAHEATGGWVAPLGLLAVFVAGLAASGLLAGRAVVLDRLH